MKVIRNRWIWLWLVLFGVGVCSAREPAKTQVELLIAQRTARSSSEVQAALHLRMPPGWHTYWRNPGDSGGATTVDWTLPEGIHATPLSWPVPELLSVGGLSTYVYHDDLYLPFSFKIDASVAAGSYAIKGKVKWLECSEQLCVPQSGTVAVDLTVGTEPVASKDEPLLTTQRGLIPKPLASGGWVAAWLENSTGVVRRVALEASLPQGSRGVEFYPYESNGSALRHTNEVSVVNGSRVRFERWVDRTEGEWPKQMNGLLVFSKPDGSRLAAVEASADIVELPPAVSTLAASTAGSAPPLSGAEWMKMLAFAFLGGLILNIMPCVLPVISLKILGFVNQSASEPRRIRNLGMMYAAGVMVSLLVLAGLIIGLKSAGKAVSWGIQFGNPQFLVILTTLITLIALNLFGVFEITLGGAASDSAGALAQKEGATGAFFNGVLAVVLATPCTAPFLGVAIGFALPQPPATILLFFAMVAIGLASPYLLLSWNPAWLRLLPRPGLWMEHFKVGMGFPMLGTAMWLFWVTGKHLGDGLLWFGLFLVILSTAAWVFGQFIQRGRSRRGLAWAVVIFLAGGGYLWAMEKELSWRHPAESPAAGTPSSSNHRGGIAWQSWSAEAVASARAQGKVVLVDFTADWCLTCNVNRRSSLEIPSVTERLQRLGVVSLLADYTKTPEVMTQEISRWGRAGVPLVLVYPKDASRPAKVLPEVLTPSIVLEALEEAAKP